MQLYSFTLAFVMKKFILLVSVLFLVSCSLPWQKENSATNLSGEVPKEAKKVDGYTYPAMPLDEFNKLQK